MGVGWVLGVVMPQGKCWGKQNSIRREGEGRETKKEGRRISVGITKRLSATPSGRGPQELLTQENQNCEFTVYSLVSTGALARTKEGNKQTKKSKKQNSLKSSSFIGIKFSRDDRAHWS